MGRYDRVSPLPPPDRSRVFPAWAVLRDLEGRERDADMARRVRLRFMALRPVLRLVRHGIDRVPRESLERQIDGVREELGQLSARDPERARLARFLRRIRHPTPLTLATATLDLGEAAEAAEHYHGAEELYFAALQVATAYRLEPEQVIALRLLGRICRKAARSEDARRFCREAAELALRLGDRRQWAIAMDGLGATLRQDGDAAGALRIHEEILARGRQWSDDEVLAEGLCGLCRAEAETGDPQRAIEYGWTAVGRAARDEQLDTALSCLGAAFLQVGLYPAAARCHWIVANRASRLAVRAQARVDLATVAARAGQADAARDHLRDAIRLAKKHGHHEILRHAEALLTVLEHTPDGSIGAPPTAAPGESARRIAAEVETFGQALVPAR
ncbi:MAG TPA: tetratricopeptide repeat protein [Longimicrobiales bacterium]